jgi:protein-tyrosine phosphatase
MGFIAKLFSSKKVESLFDLSIIGSDMHSHLIPGIDDGSPNMDDSIAMLAKFESLGYRKVITTPHIMTEVYPNTPEIINNGLVELEKAIKEVGLSIEIQAAAEYYFDDFLIQKIRNKSLLTFGDSFVLVEFSFHTEPSYEHQLLFEMQTSGYKPVIAHFERYSYYHGTIDKAIEFKEKGANIQLNLLSLSGNYGQEVKKQAERLIDAKLVDFVGTDCHRMEHLMLIEQQLKNPYFHKLADLTLKNRSL